MSVPSSLFVKNFYRIHMALLKHPLTAKMSEINLRVQANWLRTYTLAFKAEETSRLIRRTHMRRLDLSPLYKSAIGFDHLANVLDQLSGLESETGFPPYNIERLGDNVYRVTMAVAGFGESDLSIDVKEGTLTIRGEKKGEAANRAYIHQGIAARNFERRFRLADYVEVSGAALENGLLHVDLKRELPEAMKPRSIQITKGAPQPRVIEGDAARKVEAAA